MKIIRNLPDGTPLIRSFTPSMNVLPPRDFHMPRHDEQSLNGKWAFRYYESAALLPDELELRDLTDAIDVPSCWQLKGYGRPKYINTRYEFESDMMKLTPPVVPDERNAVGVYARSFSLSEGEGRVLLALDGFASQAQVYVNGQFAGYASNGRAVNEFDISSYARVGSNELIIVVYQFATGAWLECQDMWRLSGLYRGVRVYRVCEVALFDVCQWISPDSTDAHAMVQLEVKLFNMSAALSPAVHVDAVLRSADGTVVAQGHGHTGNLSARFEEKVFFSGPMPIPSGVTRTAYITLEVEDPKLWSADVPYLYDLTIEAAGQTCCLKTGIRTVTVVKGVFCINGRHVKLRGVNRHEFNPENGYVITREEMLRDIRMMKQANVNAVRCSHYTQDPLWYDLCDEYGLYVMDEANVESHGISYRGNVLPGNDLRWLPHFLDRVTAMVQMNKNHSSVVIWSLGNELGFGETVSAAAGYLRGLDTRPIHKRQMNSIADMDSETYPTIELLRNHLTNKPERMFVANEYGHSMGNACGSLGEYWDTFMSDDRLAGGFIWEWRDHGMKGGEHAISYGGDFGEEFHDGNFCLDGLVTTDSEETAKLAELKKVHEQIRFTMDDGELCVRNDYPFMTLDGYALKLSRLVGTVVTDEAAIPLTGVKPGEVFRIPVNTAFAPDTFTVLRASVVTDKPTSWCGAGHEIAFHTWVLNEPKPASRGYDVPTFSACELPLRLKLKDGCFLTYGKDGSVTLASADTELIRDIRLNVFRAPTDNDIRSGVNRDATTAWTAIGLDAPVRTLIEASCGQNENCTAVRRKLKYTCKDVTFAVTQTDYLTDDGIFIDVYVAADKVLELPRLGMQLVLPDTFRTMEYIGPGPWETYPDRKRCGKIGCWQTEIAAQQNYAFPQNYGVRMDVRSMTVRTNGGQSLTVSGAVPCPMSVLPYSETELNRAAHADELRGDGNVYLSVDYMQHGLGNRSCGPEALPDYRQPLGSASFGFLIRPASGLLPCVLPCDRLAELYKPYSYSEAAVREEDYRDPSDPDRQRAIGMNAPV